MLSSAAYPAGRAGSRPLLLAAVLILIAGAVAQPAKAQVVDPCHADIPERRIEGAALATAARAGDPVTLTGVCVGTPVDLQAIPRVQRVFRCRDCTFQGPFVAPDVQFDRTLDVGGSTFQDRVDLSGATFGDRASFRAARFRGPVDLSFARLEGDADFTDADFRGSAVETDGPGSTSPATGVDCSPNAPSLHFAGLRVNGTASFAGADFSSEVNFTSAYFSGGSDFSQAEFRRCAYFTSSRFAGPVSLRFVRSSSTVWLNRVTAGGPMDLEGAAVQGDLSLQDSYCTGQLNLRGLKVGRGRLLVSHLSAPDVAMDGESARASISSAALGPFLDRLEASAKARGDLRAANEARYARLSLDNDLRKACLDAADPRIGCTGPHREMEAAELRREYLWDRYVYRGLAGYLVKPLVPLRALFVLLLIAAMVRGLAALVPGAISGLKESSRKRSGKMRRLLDAVKAALKSPYRVGVSLAGGLHDAFASAFRKKAEISIADRSQIGQYVFATLKWGEFLAYKVLIALFILSLGNSNSTIRQLLDAVRS